MQTNIDSKVILITGASRALVLFVTFITIVVIGSSIARDYILHWRYPLLSPWPTEGAMNVAPA